MGISLLLLSSLCKIMQIRTLESESLPIHNPITNFPNGVTIRARNIAEIRIFLLFRMFQEIKKSLKTG